MPFFIPFLIAAGVAILAASSREESEVEPELDNIVVLVGPTSSGKSLLGNDLTRTKDFAVDAGHGTTHTVRTVDYLDGWSIADTPGILDGEAFAALALDQALHSRIVLFCTDGELHRPTREWFEGFLRTCNHSDPIIVIPYITKSDLRRLTMISRDAAKIESRVREQFDDFEADYGHSNIDFREPLLGEPGDRLDLRRALKSAMKSLNS
jgi:GTPase SAR1 family protein